jgi:hypothetical protein
VGAAIMARAVALGIADDPYALGVAASISGRTVWNLVTGRGPNHYPSTYAALERTLGYPPGSLRSAVDHGDPGLLEGAVATGLQRTLRDIFGAAGISVETSGSAVAVLGAAAAKIRALHPRDRDLLTVAEIADAIAAEIGGEAAFGDRLAARRALRSRDRRVLQQALRAKAAQPAIRPAPEGAPPEALRVAFQPARQA